jgi:hypothetical protein
MRHGTGMRRGTAARAGGQPPFEVRLTANSAMFGTVGRTSIGALPAPATHNNGPDRAIWAVAFKNKRENNSQLFTYERDVGPL